MSNQFNFEKASTYKHSCTDKGKGLKLVYDMEIDRCPLNFITITPSIKIWKDNAEEEMDYLLEEIYFITIHKQCLRSFKENSHMLRMHDEANFEHSYKKCVNDIFINYNIHIARNDYDELVINFNFNTAMVDISSDEEEEPQTKRQKTDDPHISECYFLAI